MKRMIIIFTFGSADRAQWAVTTIKIYFVKFMLSGPPFVGVFYEVYLGADIEGGDLFFKVIPIN